MSLRNTFLRLHQSVFAQTTPSSDAFDEVLQQVEPAPEPEPEAVRAAAPPQAPTRQVVDFEALREELMAVARSVLAPPDAPRPAAPVNPYETKFLHFATEIDSLATQATRLAMDLAGSGRADLGEVAAQLRALSQRAAEAARVAEAFAAVGDETSAAA